jgi:hypothetical protein
MESIHVAPMTITWARKLVADVVASGQCPQDWESAILFVYEKSRQNLVASIGLFGFVALANRALARAKTESRGLNTVQLTIDGRIMSLGASEPQSVPNQEDEAGVILIAHLLSLFLTFLGEELTWRLIRNVAPAHELPTKDVKSEPFEGIRQEVINLRKASASLESLANEHPAVENGLLIISANIQNIATVLDVFAVVRNASETALSTEIKESMKQYLM